MEIRNILAPEAVLILAGASSKKRLFVEISERIESILGVEAREITKALLEREDLGSTAMGSGIAIPHARIAGLDQVRGVFVRLGEPMDFEAPDRQKVDLLFVILAPKDSDAESLKVLARVSRIMRKEDVRQNLRSGADQAALYAILIDDHASAAA